MHATKDRDRLNPIEWWNMYGSSTTYLHKLLMRVLSQVVNTSFPERCWSTYNFIHSLKRNNLNVDWDIKLGLCALQLEVVVPLL
jgi:hypothetical protein